MLDTLKMQCRLIFFSGIKWELMPFFYFKLISQCLQQWLPEIVESSKMQTRMVGPPVLDAN